LFLPETGERKSQFSWLWKQVKMGKAGRIRSGESKTGKRARRKTANSFSRDPAGSATDRVVHDKIATLRFPNITAKPPPRFPTAASIALGFIALMIGSAGCNSVHKPQTDPLFGNVKPQPGLNSTNASPVPPLPGPTSTGSTAALASVNPRPVDATHDLRLTDPMPNTMGPAPGPGTQLQPPTTGFVPASRQPNPTPGADATGRPNAPLATGSMTYEEAQARLTARGVTWQRLESWGDKGDWKFTCSIPNRQNQYISRTYEAEAHDPLSAVRGVLDQLDHDQGQ
jgi:hypothetical protein